jgi:hypothetical protein
MDRFAGSPGGLVGGNFVRFLHLPGGCRLLRSDAVRCRAVRHAGCAGSVRTAVRRHHPRRLGTLRRSGAAGDAAVSAPAQEALRFGYVASSGLKIASSAHTCRVNSLRPGRTGDHGRFRELSEAGSPYMITGGKRGVSAQQDAITDGALPSVAKIASHARRGRNSAPETGSTGGHQRAAHVTAGPTPIRIWGRFQVAGRSGRCSWG